MMIRKFCIFASVLSTAVFGAPKSPQELCESLQAGVRTVASGQIEEGLGQMIAHRVGMWPSPKERAAKVAQLRDPLQEMREPLGASRRVTHISTAFISTEYARIRILDRRNGGGILWTFLCEKDGEDWGIFSWTLTGNEELGEVFKELDAADYLKPTTETTSPKSE